MSEKTEQTEVIFRKYRDGEILALFPYLPEFRYGTCLSYAHIGQHCTAHFSDWVNQSKLATPEEYKDLFNELTNVIGYNLKILNRISWRKYSKVYHASKPVKIK